MSSGCCGHRICTVTIADGLALIDMDVDATLTNGSLTKLGAGTLRLRGQEVLPGSLTLNDGALILSNASTIASGRRYHARRASPPGDSGSIRSASAAIRSTSRMRFSPGRRSCSPRASKPASLARSAFAGGNFSLGTGTPAAGAFGRSSNSVPTSGPATASTATSTQSLTRIAFFTSP